MKRRNPKTAIAMEIVPIFLTAGIILAVGGGAAYVYSQGEKALAEATYQEKIDMGKLVDPEIEDRHNNYADSQYSAFGEIISSDDICLYGPSIIKYPEEYVNVIGTIDNMSTRYLAGAYRNNLFSEYSLWNGYYKGNETKSLHTTINSVVQKEMYNFLKDNGVDGNVFVYDMHSGSIICFVSHSSRSNLLNGNLATDVPGSTMKMIAVLLMEMQGNDLTDPQYTFDCGKKYILEQDGNAINCPKNHGKGLTVIDAVGQSCNCWFAQAIEKSINWTKAEEDIKRLGFTVNSPDIQTSLLGRIKYRRGNVVMSGNSEYRPVWGLIGECDTMVSPIQVAYLTALIAQDGNAAPPYLVEEDSPTETIMISPSVCENVHEIWEKAYNEYYKDRGIDEAILMGKTGTAETSGKKGEKKRFLGCTDQYAFFIQEDNYKTDEGVKLEIQPYDIANKLVEVLNSVE